MNNLKGMSFVGMLLTIIIVILAGITLMRAVPVYIQHYSLIQSINALKTLPKSDLTRDPMVNARILKKKLTNQLYVNGVEIPEKDIKVTPGEPGTFTVLVNYDVKKPLFSHLNLLFEFRVKKGVSFGSS